MGCWQCGAEEGLAAPFQLRQNETLSRSPPIPDSCGCLVFTEDILLFKGDTFALLKWNNLFFPPPCFQSPLYAIPIPRGHWSENSLLCSQTKTIFCSIGFSTGIRKKKKKGKETPVCGEKMVPALVWGQVVHSAWLKGQRPRDQWLWHVHLWSCSCHLQCYGDRGKHVPVPPPPAGGLRWKKWQDPIRSLSEEWLSSDSSVFNPAKSFCFSWCPTIKTKVKREKN